MKDKGLESLQKDASFTPKPKNPSLEVNIGVSQRMNQLQANLEADAKKEPKKIAVKQTYQLAEAIMSGKDVDTRKEYEAQKEARRKKHEQEVAELNRLKEEYQKRKEADERAEEETRKREMEKNNNTIVVNGQGKHGGKGGLSQREEEIKNRVPPLEILSSTSEEELREVASELTQLLKEVYGDIFDLKMVKNHLDKEFQDLEREVQEEAKNIAVFVPVEGKVKQRKEEAWQKSKFQESSAKPKRDSKEVIKTGSVKNRLAMFENGKK